MWVRSFDSIAPYTRRAIGGLLSDEDALKYYGADALENAAYYYGSEVVLDEKLLGETIRNSRERLGMTYRTLATYLPEVDEMTIVDLENGHNKIRWRWDTFSTLCRLLNINPFTAGVP